MKGRSEEHRKLSENFRLSAEVVRKCSIVNQQHPKISDDLRKTMKISENIRSFPVISEVIRIIPKFADGQSQIT